MARGSHTTWLRARDTTSRITSRTIRLESSTLWSPHAAAFHSMLYRDMSSPWSASAAVPTCPPAFSDLLRRPRMHPY
jgi:hypothetical protein